MADVITTPASVLLVGPVATDVERDDLRSLGFDLCDQLGCAVTIATHDALSVLDFAAVCVAGPTLDDANLPNMDPVALTLSAEAVAYGVPTFAPQGVCLTACCEACGQVQTIATVRNERGEVFCADCRGEAAGCAWCFEDCITEPADVDGTWQPLCGPCGVQTQEVVRAMRAAV
ncbi:hypothetical protein [Streptomyces sp. NBC_00344]|uniref:hypothetical protein n=1 Tax=Streptomyces sp. NBC_00344 TaxID=2975720 RepID=UPI002E1D0126